MYLSEHTANVLRLSRLHNKIRSVSSSSSSNEGGDNRQEVHATTLVSKAFMDWVVKSGRAGQLIDLLRLDKLRKEQN